jgi:hypothetical protein
MKHILFSSLLFLSITTCFAQGYNEERTALANFLTRMYNHAPFEGVRVVDDYDNSYLISVLSLDRTRHANERDMNRVASVRGMSQASRFFNGSNITSDLIIRTSEKSDGSADTEIIETIRENSAGFIRQLELLTTFPRQGQDDEQVFIFFKRIERKRNR